MTLSGFKTVTQLSATEQRRLLECGDAPERLWAAWAIALELGRDALPLVTAAERAEISEGLRRQLLIVLAGLGERFILATIADSDSSASVRATAVTLYLRTAASSAEARAFALRQLRTAPAEVRYAILTEQERGNVEIPVKELLPTLRDPDLATRKLCVACLSAMSSGAHDADVAHALIDALAEEKDSEVCLHCLRALPRAALSAALQAVARRSPDALVDAIEMAHTHLGTLTWSEVVEVAQTSHLDVVRAILVSGARPDLAGELNWLCDVYRIAREVDSRVARDVVWRSFDLIQAAITEETVRSLSQANRDALREAFLETLAQVRHDLDEYGPDSADDAIDELERVLRALA